MLQRPFSSSSRLTHQTVSVLVLIGLIFLRIPFLAGIAVFWEPGQTLAYFVFIIGTYLLTAFFIWWERERLRTFWIDLAGAIIFLCQYYMFPFGIGLFAAMRRSQARFPAPPSGLIRWMLTGALLGILSSILMIQTDLFPAEERTAAPAGLFFLFRAVLIQMVNAAVWEEPLFRGILWGHLRLAGWKNGWIWLFQALLFTAAHCYYLRTEPFGSYFIRMMLPALLLGFIAWRARSIAASMVTHGFINASGDLLMHTGTLPQALTIAWSGAAIIAMTLVIVMGWEFFRRRRLQIIPQR
jgi:membrane protease YdiL (CAAX protease family)